MTNSEVKITKVFNVPIDKVWDALTNPESIKQWHAPEGMTNPEVTGELLVGGKYKIVMEGHNMPNESYNGIMSVGGEYIEIDKPHKLVFTWLWDGAPAQTHTTTVSMTLNDMGDKTELELIHNGFADDNMMLEHNAGWESTLTKLEKFLS